MDRGAWQASAHGVTRVGHNLATQPPPPYVYMHKYIYLILLLFGHRKT